MGQAFAHRIEGRPDYAMVSVDIPAGRTLAVESGGMAFMSPNLKVKTKMGGGFRRFLTGESLFISQYTAEGGEGVIGVAPGNAGDIIYHRLEGDVLYLQSSAYLASDPDIQVDSKWQGLVRGFFSGAGLFLAKCSGHGDLWFTTFGALLEVPVTDTLVVDTGHVAAFTGSLDYSVEMLSGYKSLFFSGEGLVCRFRGEGQVWIQTRNVPPFASWLQQFRRSGNN